VNVWWKSQYVSSYNPSCILWDFLNAYINIIFILYHALVWIWGVIVGIRANNFDLGLTRLTLEMLVYNMDEIANTEHCRPKGYLSLVDHFTRRVVHVTMGTFGAFFRHNLAHFTGVSPRFRKCFLSSTVIGQLFNFYFEG